MLPNPLLTVATAADLPALVALVNSAYRGESSRQGWTTEADLIDGTRTDEATVQAQLENPAAIILKCEESDGTLLGCVYLEALAEGGLYVGMVTVRPDQQARGIGKRLLAAAEDRARQLKSRFLRMTVIAVRAELLAWYERQGYRRTGGTEAFPEGEPFGILRQPLVLLVLEKEM